MNPRIQELKQLATEIEHSHGAFGEPERYYRLNIEKFAELIIEACAQQCWTVSELESKGFVVSECTKRMRKHFGVTE